VYSAAAEVTPSLEMSDFAAHLPLALSELMFFHGGKYISIQRRKNSTSYASGFSGSP